MTKFHIKKENSKIDWEIIKLITTPEFIKWYHINYLNGFSEKTEFNKRFNQAVKNNDIKNCRLTKTDKPISANLKKYNNFNDFMKAPIGTIYCANDNMLVKEEKVYDPVGGILRSIDFIN